MRPLADRTTAATEPPEAPAPPSPARFLHLVADKLAATEEIFQQSLASDVPFIQEAGSYLSNGGGKRVRPALLLLCARMLGHDSDDERRIYQQMGKPDRVEERGAERSWWYFADGRMFRFDDGELVETRAFDPVEKL